MSFLRNLMRPFVEFEEKEVQEEKTAAAAVPETDRQANSPARIPDHQSFPPDGINITTSAPQPPVALVEYQKHFEDLIEEANANNPVFQGTDFKEFVDSKADTGSIADETTRYHTTFNILKRAGLTKEKLVRTGQEYVKLIDNDLKGFEAAYLQKYRNDVEQKEKLLKGKEEELQLLDQKIHALKQEIQTISQQVVQNRERLDANKKAFFLAGEKKRNEIQAELQKIERHFS